jgi:carbonic anhydrase
MLGQLAQGRAFTVGFTLLSLAAGGCDMVRAKVRSVVCEPAAGSGGAGAAGGAAHAVAQPAGAAAPVQEAAHEPDDGPVPYTDDTPHLTAAAKFALPFAWEKSPTEPLSRARTFLREMADDNAQYMTKQSAAVRSYAAGESPRTTVLTCADSRVQAAAFDASPENDDYTVRNLGNQIEAGLGSVQYGVERLKTPVLLILGHTGCEAVRAAASGDARLEDAIRHELSGIHVKKVKGRLDDRALGAAVIENVHDQVRAALKRFSPRVTSNDLTIVGAIYDLRNDLGRGAGKLSIINVNGNRDEPRLKAFMEAIMATPNPKGKHGATGEAKENPLERLARALSESADLSDEEEDEGEEEEEPAAEQEEPAKPAAIPAKQAHH